MERNIEYPSRNKFINVAARGMRVGIGVAGVVVTRSYVIITIHTKPVLKAALLTLVCTFIFRETYYLFRVRRLHFTMYLLSCFLITLAHCFSRQLVSERSIRKRDYCTWNKAQQLAKKCILSGSYVGNARGSFCNH